MMKQREGWTDMGDGGSAFIGKSGSWIEGSGGCIETWGGSWEPIKNDIEGYVD